MIEVGMQVKIQLRDKFLSEVWGTVTEIKGDRIILSLSATQQCWVREEDILDVLI